jgi:hypothetical protein
MSECKKSVTDLFPRLYHTTFVSQTLLTGWNYSVLLIFQEGEDWPVFGLIAILNALLMRGFKPAAKALISFQQC